MSDEQTKLQSNWGRWGEADERCMANLATEARLKQAATLVKTGKTYSLSLPVQSASVPTFPRRQPPLHMMTLDGGDYAAGLKRHSGTQTADDYIGMHTHGGTHIDALSHVWYGDQIYNGFSSNTIRSGGAKHCGIEKLKHLAGRGVLLDLCAFKGEPFLPLGYVITPADLEGAAAAAGVAVGEGDILLIRTGWLASYDEKQPKEFFRGEPGIGKDAAEWLGARGVCGIGMDNFAIEAVPTEDGTLMPVHRRLIRDLGCYLMELLVLDELAKDGVHEFLFVAAPLLITGGVGSPINPLAIC